MGEKKKQGGAPHRALYRKYRSKSLDEVIGQDHITKTLGNAISQGRISHAYLFTGPKGTGKTSIARILAHEINQLPYTDDSTNLDIIEIDAASNRRIDDIRELRDKVNIAPVSAKYKVYIIDEVHMLTTESFNALLKTLEEPPSHVVFILATTEVHKLPATIMSRTQRHAFRLISPEKVAAHLKAISKAEDINIDDEALKLLAEHGEGSFRDSISLLDQMSSSSEPITAELIELVLGLAPEEALGQLLNATKQGDSKAVMTGVESLLEGGLTPSGIANQLLKMLRTDAANGVSAGTVRLMEELLNVQSAQYPQMKLETILLSISPQIATTVQPAAVTAPKPAAAPNQPETKQPVSEPAPKPKTVASAVEAPQMAEAVPKAEKPRPKPTKKGELNISDSWQEILDLTKAKNNTLYTVLRLAHPEVVEQQLKLAFNFPFHQKKVNEVRYKGILAEIVTEVTGHELSIEAVLDKTKTAPATKVASEKPADPAHASLIAGVQDIMGGGEVVSI